MTALGVGDTSEKVLAFARNTLRELWPLAQAAHAELDKRLHPLNSAFLSWQPWEIAVIAAAATAGLVALLAILSHWLTLVAEAGGVVPCAFRILRSLPIVRSQIAAKKMALRQQLLASRPMPARPLICLPEEGLSDTDVITEMLLRKQDDRKVIPGSSRASGTIYMRDAHHKQLMDRAFTEFSETNPLHADAWPSVVRMEAEVVSMTAALLGGCGPESTVCGTMTSGGSESILLAMKASRDWQRDTRGVRRPEMVVADSAHAAYIKAAEYFKIKRVVLPVGKDLKLSARAVKRALTRNTAIVVASAPCYPHGVIDHVADIAKVCAAAGVCLHVDACLGGFVLPFASHLGRPIPPFDFRVKGVTSMSVDTHKFALAHKGSSVVLYAHPELRQHQFTSITDWTGGLYISPSMSGSRAGGLIASAWAALVVQGSAGFIRQTESLLELSDRFQAGLASIPELKLLGAPDMCLVAFGANPVVAPHLNVYKVKDEMSKKGWYLSALQRPPGLHFCFTPAHTGGEEDVVAALLSDLREAVKSVLTQPDAAGDSGGSAPMYAASVIPDRRLVGDFLVLYQDVMLTA